MSKLPCTLAVLTAVLLLGTPPAEGALLEEERKVSSAEGAAQSAKAKDTGGEEEPAPDEPTDVEGEPTMLSTTSPPVPAIEYEKRQSVEERLRAYGPNLMGDGIDPHMGGLSFEHTDVILPGNSRLPVAITRRRSQGMSYHKNEAVEFGDWELVTPRITVTTAAVKNWTGNRCSNSYDTSFPYAFSGGTYWWKHQYSNGVSLDVPGYGSQQVLEGVQGDQWPSDTSHVTVDGWRLTCLSGASDGGQGFYAYAPNGDRYRFDRFVVRQADFLGSIYFGGGPTLNRNVSILFASEVRDVHGNTVTYSYDSVGRLKTITANDGRKISLTYSGSSELIRTVIANPGSADQRSWVYTYGTSYYPEVQIGTESRPNSLRKVTLPDGTSWSLEMGGMNAKPGMGDLCPQRSQTITLKHPSGVTGTFRLDERRHRTSYNVQDEIVQSCPNEDTLPPPAGSPKRYRLRVAKMLSVGSKTLSGASTPTAEWRYAYESDTGPVGSSGEDRTNWSRVTEPDGATKTYTHYWTGEPLGGKLVKLEVRQTDGASPIQVTEHSYLQEARVGGPLIGTGTTSDTVAHPTRVEETTVTRGTDWYKTRYTYKSNHSSPSYSFGKPTRVEEWSNTSDDWAGRRITGTTYFHRKDKWVLGLPDEVRRNGKLFDHYHYWFDQEHRFGKVREHQRFGHRVATYDYHGTAAYAGMPSSSNDGLGRQTAYTNYKRGVPRRVTRADGTLLTRGVDDDGRLTSFIDAMGVTTGYAYDAMGRLTRIDRPNSPIGWTDTVIGYSGHGSGLVQTVTRGARTTRITYDGMLRPVLTEEVGASAGASVFTRTAYDGLGRATFTSWPSTSSSAAAGIYTDYDALGRPTTVRERASATGTIHATTSYTYPRGDRFTVTDPEGHQTHRFFDAWGDPDAGVLKTITQYQGGSTLLSRTDMTYDIWGNMLTARQHGTSGGYSVDETQRYYYDTRLRLCRHWTPQTGSMLYGYDNANQLTDEARGQGGWSASCGSMPSMRIKRSYDALGRLDRVDYLGNASPAVDYDYDANSNVTAVNRGGVNWTYDYFYAGHEDLPKSEKLTLDGRSYYVSYGYSMGGARTSTLCPSGLSIIHAPDPLGRPQRAQKRNAEFYASNIQYHANGQIKQLKYGNDQWLTQSLNARQLPLERKVSGNGFTVLHQRHNGYYRTGQIKDLDDLRDRSLDRYFAYDGRGRLVSASGPWGTGSYKYDALGNLRQKTLGSATLISEYMDGTNGTPNKGRLRRYKGAYQDGSTGGAWRSFAYDARGNVLGDGQHAWTYDLSDQPIRMEKPSAGTWTDFVYDGHLRRVKQTRSDGSVIYSVYGQDGTLLHRDEVKGGTRTRTDYIRAGGETVARIVNGAPAYVHADHLGSPVAETRPDGTLRWRECYTPFGEEWRRGGRCAPSEPWDDEIAFTGHVKDKDSGLTYMQARYYDPKVGRFYANDPVAFSPERPGYFNRYWYAMGDPVNGLDPDGRQCVRSAMCSSGPGPAYQPRSLAQVRESSCCSVDANTNALHQGRAAAHQNGALTGAIEETVKQGADFTPAGAGIALLEAASNPSAGSIANVVGSLPPGPPATKSIGKLENIAAAIRDWIGSNYKVVRNDDAAMVIISNDAGRRFRMDLGGHGDAPHAHLEELRGRRYRDATDEHRLYFKDDD